MYDVPERLNPCLYLAVGADPPGQIKEEAKAKLTLASKGTSGGEGPRTHVQGTRSSPFPLPSACPHPNRQR